jgi:hypothetical protein
MGSCPAVLGLATCDPGSANRVDDVMGVLNDGGPIYTLGGQYRGQGGGNAT